MATRRQSLDISAIPELSRLADEVRSTGIPRVLRRAGEEIAVLAPLTVPPDRRRATITDRRHSAALEVVARTRGALRGDIPFPGIQAERAATEAAMAEGATPMGT